MKLFKWETARFYVLQRKDKECAGLLRWKLVYEAVSWIEIELKPDHRHTGHEE